MFTHAIFRQLPALALIVILAQNAASQNAAAQNVVPVSSSSLVRRLDVLEAEIARARSQSNGSTIANSYYDGTPACDGCVSGCDECASGCDECVSGCNGYLSGYGDANAGVYAGAELVVVKPFFEDGSEVNDDDEVVFDLHASPRLWLGVRTQEGLGVRGRYWWSDMNSNVKAGNQTRMQFKVFDLEGTRSVNWGPVHADFFGGVRYARVSHYFIRGGNAEERAGTDVEGLGPSVGVDTLTHLGNTNWGIVANVRGAWLFGDVNNASDVRLDKPFFPAEFRVGLQYSRCIAGGELTLHALAEAQYWTNTIENSDNLDNERQNDDLSLIGFAIGGQYRY